MAMTAKALASKLNPTCLNALDSAAGLCQSRTNYNLEIEHWLVKLLELSDTDLARIFRHFGVDPARVNRELTRALDRLKTGNARLPELSPRIADLMREAWSLASLEYSEGRIRSGHLLLALLTDETLAALMGSSSAELTKIPAAQLQKELAGLVAGSAEDVSPAAAAAGPGPGSKTPALDQFTINLTERARKGEIDPVIGRDFEIRQVIDILTRRRQNNPILTGEAGVGKTAVVEGFALRVVAGDVPESLQSVAVRTLDLGLLQAGAGVKGEFENRLKNVIAEVKASPQPVILFIDEAHTIIGAGGAAGQGDAANLLKPALARGELRTIAATTSAEYKKFFEKDAALKRRFQEVKVDEPAVDRATRMMRGLTAMLENHHGVRVLDEAVADAVKLSHRYITDRQLPDKCVSLLDTACARVALGHSATPPALEDSRREIELLDVELNRLRREQAVGAEHAVYLDELRERRRKAEDRKAALEQRWAEEKRLVTQIQKIRTRLEGQIAAPTPDGPKGKPAEVKERPSSAEEAQAREELRRLTTELKKLQGETPLVQPVVDSQAVAEVVSGWTGVPVGKMVLDEIKTVLALKDKLEERVIGQSAALEAVAQRIRTARANLLDPRQPVGVMLLVGPSGVGKTETALALADILYGGARNLVVVNMSEYQESHTVSKLKGSPAGYVGYGEGGVLTEAVRRRPYSVVLLDEIEKAHPDVVKVFYQVFDKGSMEDAEGTEIDFKNTIILMTSNLGTDTIVKICADPDTRPDAEGLKQAIWPDLLKHAAFPPAMLGRLTVVPYYPLPEEIIRRIIRLQLGRVSDRMRENHRATLTFGDDVVSAIADRCTEVSETGARNVQHIINGTLLPDMARELLARMAEGRALQRVQVGVDKDAKFTYAIS
jgi:type VI secretion system protein VasG